MRSLARGFLVILGLVLLVGAPLQALAQGQVEITAPPPARPPRPEFIIPGQPPDVTRPREQDFYPDQIRTRHDPAFIVPFSTTVATGPKTAVRFGLSAWTAPAGRGNVPWAAREVGGWFALGFSFVWDVSTDLEKPR